MKIIRYKKEANVEAPYGIRYGKAAQTLYDLVVLDVDPERSGEEHADVTYEESDAADEFIPYLHENPVLLDLEQAQSMASVREIASILVISADEEELSRSCFETSLSWPFLAEGVTNKVSSKMVLDALVEKSNQNIKIAPLRLIQMASNIAASESSSVIRDEHIYEALCAFYCSFDERFRVALYPSSYDITLASSSADEFYLSAALESGCATTAITDVNPTAMWLMLLVKDPIPSLLYDYLSKTHQDTGVSEEIHQDNTQMDDITSLRELCDYYMDSLISTTTSIATVNPSEDFCRMVADSILLGQPATIRDVVYMLFDTQGADDDAFMWSSYCDKVMDACAFADAPANEYPSYVTLSEALQREILFGTEPDVKAMLASAAFTAYLDEALEGGAPEVVHLDMDAYALGDEMMSPDAKHTLDDGRPVIPPEEKEILRASRKLGQFGVPLMFQQLVAATLIRRNGSLVGADDIIAAVTPEVAAASVAILSASAVPSSTHAGVSDDAATILATAGIITRRLALTMPLNESGFLRVYANSLATAIAANEANGQISCCSKPTDWRFSMSTPVFDPRTSVLFSADSTKTSAGVQNQAMLTISIPVGDSTGFGDFFQPMNPNAQPQSADDRKMPYLAKFSTDMVELATQGEIGDGIVGRDETISLIETVLTRRDKSNPLLLAPAGAGKSAIAEAIAKRISDGTSTLSGRKMRSLDLTSLIADGCSAGALADRMEHIMSESVANNVILFIDEIHVIASIGNGEMNLGNIMKPYLARNGVALIGATTEREYNYTIAKDRALSRRFSAMHLPALEFEQVIAILEEKKRIYSKYHGVVYEPRVTNTIALLTKEYMGDKESPDRELDVLDTSASVAIREGEVTVSERHVVEAVRLLTANRSVKTQAEIARELVADEWTREMLDEGFPEVAGQYKAKEAIMRRLSESKLGLSARNKPKNIFLFAGDSGVGKTYMAHEMAPLLDLDRDADVLTISLGEYQDRAAHTRLIGASPQYVGYQEGGVLTNFVKAHPDGIVILDEIDKCHDSILQMFLGVFDNSILAAADGSVADCKSITFVCTTNSGHGLTKKSSIGFGTAESTARAEQDAIEIALREELGEAFMSRVDEVVIFEQLTDEDYIDICRISYRRLSERLMARHGLDLSEAYSEENLVKDVEAKLEDAEKIAKDARTIWSSFERQLIPKAISLFNTDEGDDDVAGNAVVVDADADADAVVADSVNTDADEDSDGRQ